jgi:hypothetical protein
MNWEDATTDEICDERHCSGSCTGSEEDWKHANRRILISEILVFLGVSTSLLVLYLAWTKTL